MCNLNRLCKLAISQSKQCSVYSVVVWQRPHSADRVPESGRRRRGESTAAPISPVTHAPYRGTHRHIALCAPATMTVKIDEKEKSACKRKYETSFPPESKSVKESSPKLKRKKVLRLLYILFNKDSAACLSNRFLST